MASSAIVKLQISPARSRLAQDELSGRVRAWKRAWEAGCMLCIKIALSSGVELRYMKASSSNSCNISRFGHSLLATASGPEMSLNCRQDCMCNSLVCKQESVTADPSSIEPWLHVA